MIENNVKRINKIRKSLTESYDFKDAGRKSPMKTLLVRVLTPDLKERLEKRRKKPDWLPNIISDNSLTNLKQLLNDYQKMKETILGYYYKEFEKDPVGLMTRFAKSLPAGFDNQLTMEMEDGQPVQSGFSCSQCGKPIVVCSYKWKTDKGKEKPSYVGKCSNPEHVCLIMLEQNNPKDEPITYSLGKFGKRALDFYKLHVTRKTPHSLKLQLDKSPYQSGSFGKALGETCCGTIASFLTKYQDIIIEHQKTIKENIKRLEKLKNIAVDKGLVFPDFRLPSQPHTKSGIKEYNDIIAKTIIWTNLNLWQKFQMSRDDASPLKRLKGFPSFPVVGRDENNVDWWKTVDDLLAIIERHKEPARKFWTELPDEKRVEIIASYLPIEKDRQKKKDEDKNYPKKPARRQLGDLLLHLQKKHNGQWVSVFDEAWARVRKKVDELKAHLKRIEDPQSRKALADWLRAVATFALENLKNTDEAKFIGEELRVRKLYGDLIGTPFAKQYENQVVDIAGFSPQYNCALVWRTNENRKMDYYLVIGYLKGGKLKIDKKNINPVIEREKFYTVIYPEEAKPYTAEVKFSFDDPKLIILPLAFGKRQGREFFYNEMLSLELGHLKFNNGRVISKPIYNPKTGKDEQALYVAIAFERQKVLDVDPSKLIPTTLIGVDRGENIPAVLALTDSEGCPLPRFKDKNGNSTHIIYVGEGYKEKQQALQAAKEEEQRRAGGYSRKYASKAKNLANDMVRNSARDILYYAIQNDARIVLEDLARGFGRQGKRTFMSNRQYTKMEDMLIAKLAYEGLWTYRGKLKAHTMHSYLAKTIAQYTSKTCSNCGFVVTNAHYDEMFENLSKTESGWKTFLNDNELEIEGEITYYSRIKKHEITRNLSEEFNTLAEESKTTDIKAWSKKRKEFAVFLLKKKFNYRPEQERFVCINCGYQTHADEQAALNIARSWLFLESPEYESYQKNKDTDKKFYAWQSFYKRKLAEIWKPTA